MARRPRWKKKEERSLVTPRISEWGAWYLYSHENQAIQFSEVTRQLLFRCAMIMICHGHKRRSCPAIFTSFQCVPQCLARKEQVNLFLVSIQNYTSNSSETGVYLWPQVGYFLKNQPISCETDAIGNEVLNVKKKCFYTISAAVSRGEFKTRLFVVETIPFDV